VKGPENYKLTTLCGYLNLEIGEAHRAAGDLVSNLALLRHLVNLSGRALPDLIESSAAAEVTHRLSFGKHKGKLLQNVPKPYREWLLSQDIDANLRYSLEQLKRVDP